MSATPLVILALLAFLAGPRPLRAQAGGRTAQTGAQHTSAGPQTTAGQNGGPPPAAATALWASSLAVTPASQTVHEDLFGVAPVAHVQLKWTAYPGAATYSVACNGALNGEGAVVDGIAATSTALALTLTKNVPRPTPDDVGCRVMARDATKHPLGVSATTHVTVTVTHS